MSTTSAIGNKVPLTAFALAPTTHKKYTQALRRFLEHCDRLQVRVSTAQEVDRQLALYVQWLYDHGGTKGEATNAVFGLQHSAPHLRTRLALTKLALAGWRRKHPSVSHPPLTWELTCLLACWLAARGHYNSALALLVGFDCYLRIGEILGLRVSDVATPRDRRLGSAFTGVLLRLAQTKTGTNQSVTVECPAVAQLLMAHIATRRPSEKVFEVSRHTFYEHFHAACEAARIDGHNYSPHSLRHGGATRHYLQNRPIEDIKFRGRWSSSKSVRTYIQSGKALLLTTAVDPDIFTLAAECARLIQPLMLKLKQRGAASS